MIHNSLYDCGLGNRKPDLKMSTDKCKKSKPQRRSQILD